MAMTLHTFSMELMVHGYHEYNLVWDNPFIGEDLLCKREVGNPRHARCSSELRRLLMVT